MPWPPGRTPCGCVGWNDQKGASSNAALMSHPVRVRGLEQLPLDHDQSGRRSHPVRVRGLERRPHLNRHAPTESHPVRVRGLERGEAPGLPPCPAGRTPCGCVGWNSI